MGMKKNLLTLSLIAVVPLLLPVAPTAGTSPAAHTAAATSKPRVVLTHDPELDDVNTVIRALLYSTDFNVEGLVYSSASIHFKGDVGGR